MARFRTIYVCKACGYVASGWLGKCPSCGEWGSFSQEESDAAGQRLNLEAAARAFGAPAAFRVSGGAPSGAARAYRLDEIDATDEDRAPTGIGELDRALGGGFVKGSLVLLGGDPGIGKSTLLLQMCAKLGGAAETSPLTRGGGAGPGARGRDGDAQANGNGAHGTGTGALYVSGEESVRQLKLRAERLGITGGGATAPLSFAVAAETRLEAIASLAKEHGPRVAVIDSIQTTFDSEIQAAPGTVTQIRGVTLKLMRMAKTAGITFVIVGHVTKDGAIAGPKLLEHMVDTVLYFEGERHAGFRILRAVKNRFGAANELGVFEMTDQGLAEVANPSLAMIGERPLEAPGSVVTPVVEGARPMLVEIQALASRTSAANPRRSATGLDYNRVSLMAAILEKRAGMNLFERDLFVNVTGGVRVTEPASDLGVACAIASSYHDLAFDPWLAMAGEVGLTGEARGVSRITERVAEAARLGFLRFALPKGNMAAIQRARAPSGIELIPIGHVSEAIALLRKPK